jgi:GNAT superfamily N-acetyltransferase
VDFEIRVVGELPEELDQVRKLFAEYADELQVDLCVQGFDDELASLPGKYSEPSGCLVLVFDGEESVGCAGLRSLGGGDVELKRYYVSPKVRGRGAGSLLLKELIRLAREKGYERMVLDTVPKLKPALALYEKFGFKECEPYWNNPECGVIYMELNL